MSYATVIKYLFGEKVCIFCQDLYVPKKNSYLCPVCSLSLIPYAYGLKCIFCKKDVCICQFLCFILFEYNFLLRRIILQAKYNDKFQFLHFFAEQVIEKLENLNIDYKKYELIYVPSSWKKTLKRGYNQCAELCKYIAAQTGQKINHNLLIKTGYSSQKNSSSSQRFLNTQFIKLKNSVKKNKNYILIEDIIGSGSTVLRIAHLLQDVNLIVIAMAKH